MKGALDPIIAEFSKAGGHTVKYTVGSPLVVSQKLAAGEGLDVVVKSAPAMAALAKLAGLKPDSRVPVARNGIGVAVHPNAAVPNISTADAFKKTLLAANSIGVGDPAMPNGSGMVIQKILAASGIMGAINDKVKVVGLDPGQEMIAKGVRNFVNLPDTCRRHCRTTPTTKPRSRRRPLLRTQRLRWFR